jgi:serine/threonine-protein kinase
MKMGDYELVSKHASSAVEEQWLARAPDGSEVMLRRLLPDLDDQARALAFQVNTLHAARAPHPNLVRVLHAAPDFAVAELVVGIAVSVVSRTAPVEAAIAAGIAVQACRGLDFIHFELGQLHGDVEAHNLVLGFDGVVRWLPAEPRPSPRSSVVLTPKSVNWSPEQVRGDPLDARHEQFQLGLLFYKLLTGKHPFAGDSEFETLHRVRACVIPAEGLPPELAPIVLRALAKEPTQRFSDVGALGAAIAPHGVQAPTLLDYAARFR